MKTLQFCSLAVLTPVLMLAAPVAMSESNNKEPRQKTEMVHRLTLSEAIDLAFQQNPDLAAAEAAGGEAFASMAASYGPYVAAAIILDQMTGGGLGEAVGDVVSGIGGAAESHPCQYRCTKTVRGGWNAYAL